MKDGGVMVKALDLNAGGARLKTRGGQYVFRHMYTMRKGEVVL